MTQQFFNLVKSIAKGVAVHKQFLSCQLHIPVAF
ncbi:hypothetical protein HKBW3S03_00289 [Candidatus Hakubella thermalkaliphila]|uniref:Uncharacterized protein n=1 Tax=Candidatus Hakubella thermalkaliphila TaxID=2754717 RepID=A0A6V8NHD8_9ACTN|nr:hypothetical protein HKBW3S03_00289 [Candidatus Hakubella thermalkaliphila]GFP38355.1 hypothetical protein HKBW3S47_00056 [Candidatus Hakubella thermalkaliphila]